MILYVGNMMCNRCKMLVEAELQKIGLHGKSINLGEVEIDGTLSDTQIKTLRVSLKALGFELIDDKKSRLIEKIKDVIHELIHHSNEPLKINISEHISKRINYEYSYLSNLFSEFQGITIEKYVIGQKIDKVKEMLIYDEFSLSQIAEKMNYSDVSHLSRQFKKVTGLTPSSFKQLKQKRRVE